jgi:hypothetical protein
VRELLDVLAANGEQGELGSGWCSGCWVLRVFRGVLDLRGAVHVLGGFCGREGCFGVSGSRWEHRWVGSEFLEGLWSVFGGRTILKNRGVGFVGDCCYLCMIYILSVVCLSVRGILNRVQVDLVGSVRVSVRVNV